MIKYHALFSFPYYPDGITRVDVIAGQTVEIKDDLAEGLEKAGYIRPAEEQPPVVPVVQVLDPVVEVDDPAPAAPEDVQPTPTLAEDESAPVPGRRGRRSEPRDKSTE